MVTNLVCVHATLGRNLFRSIILQSCVAGMAACAKCCLVYLTGCWTDDFDLRLGTEWGSTSVLRILRYLFLQMGSNIGCFYLSWLAQWIRIVAYWFDGGLVL